MEVNSFSVFSMSLGRVDSEHTNPHFRQISSRKASPISFMGFQASSPPHSRHTFIFYSSLLQFSPKAFPKRWLRWGQNHSEIASCASTFRKHIRSTLRYHRQIQCSGAFSLGRSQLKSGFLIFTSFLIRFVLAVFFHSL